MNKFNIAFVPKVKGLDIIKLAEPFSSISDHYLLGADSLPHVTLYQFTADKGELAHMIARLTAAGIKRVIELQFQTFSCISFDDAIFWASLMPDKASELTEMHELIAGIISRPVKPNYDPHMTLMSTRHRDYELLVDAVKRDYEPIGDEFILTIGESDDVGQYLRQIHSF